MQKNWVQKIFEPKKIESKKGFCSDWILLHWIGLQEMIHSTNGCHQPLPATSGKLHFISASVQKLFPKTYLTQKFCVQWYKKDIATKISVKKNDRPKKWVAQKI